MTGLIADDWPIAAAALPFAGRMPDGRTIAEAGPDEWARTLTDIADAGFDRVDLTDSWLRVADLDESGLRDLAAVSAEAGVMPTSISAIRCSVIDHAHGDDNLAYSHRTLDAAAALGIETVSFGLHQALTPQQHEQLWFWTVPGHQDDPADWDLAVSRLRELGRHAAELGILVSLEMYEDTFLGTADSAVRLVEEIGLDNVGLNPDVGNLVRLHRPVEDWRELYAATLPYANYWHLKNYSRDEAADGSWQTAVPTTLDAGVIDYRWAVREAIALGYRGLFTCEHYGGDSLAMCGRAQEYLRRVLPRTIPAADHELAQSSAERN